MSADKVTLQEGGAVLDALQKLRRLRDQARNGIAPRRDSAASHTFSIIDSILAVIEPALATREGEAVAWVGSEELALIRGGYQTVTATLWREKISGTEPLYTHPAPDALREALADLIENAVAARGCGLKNDPDGIVSSALFDTIMNGRAALSVLQSEQKGGA